jgi:type II secretory pathway pseudopilin PulG
MTRRIAPYKLPESRPVRAPHRAVRRHAGFTLLELLALLALLGLAALMLAPALAHTRLNSRVLQCLNNNRRLAAAFVMYPTEFAELYPPNPDDGTTLPGYAWVGGQAGVGGAAEFNPDILKDPTRSLLWPYLGGAVELFRCPADTRSGLYSGSDPTQLGKLVPSARTVSLNAAVGTVDLQFYNTGAGHSGRPNHATRGPWLTGVHGQNNPATDYATYGSPTDFRNVTPGQIFSFVDENPYSLNDCVLSTSVGTKQFIDYPATFHDHGCVASFCDGHTETHHWKGTAINYGGIYLTGLHNATTPLDMLDWTWLANASSRHQ